MDDQNYVVLSPDNRVENIIVWNGVSYYELPEGWTLELAPTDSVCNPGFYKYSDGTYHSEPEIV